MSRITILYEVTSRKRMDRAISMVKLPHHISVVFQNLCSFFTSLKENDSTSFLEILTEYSSNREEKSLKVSRVDFDQFYI